VYPEGVGTTLAPLTGGLMNTRWRAINKARAKRLDALLKQINDEKERFAAEIYSSVMDEIPPSFDEFSKYIKTCRNTARIKNISTKPLPGDCAVKDLRAYLALRRIPY
jgi:hypothetical protein